MIHYFTTHRLLNPLQFGFRANHITVTALLNVTDDVRRELDHYGQLEYAEIYVF